MHGKNRQFVALFAFALVASCERTEKSVSDSVSSNNDALAHAGNIPISAPPVSSEILVDIGGAIDDETLELFPSAYTKFVPLANGGFALTDEVRVRFYDNNGRQVATFGRKGAGPGEFLQIQTMCMTRGDSLLVYDRGLDRMFVLDGNRKIAFTHSVANIGTPQDRPCFDDGTLLVRSPKSDGIPRGHQRLSRVRLDGSLVNDLGIVRSSDYSRNPWTEVLVTAADSTFLVADPSQDTLRLYHRNGSLLRSLVLADARDRSGSTIEQPKAQPYLGWPIAGHVNQGSAMPPSPSREQWPIFRRAVLDIDGNVWILTHDRAINDPVIWSKYDWRGKQLASIMLPGRQAGTPTRAPISAGRFLLGHRSTVVTAIEDDDGALHYQMRPLK